MLWQLQEAKNKFSKLVQTAKTSGPQTVTLRGEPTVVVMSLADYEHLRGANPVVEKPTLAEFLLMGEPWDDEFAELVCDRNKSTGRVIEF
jgi:prevent-host-death family protein